MGRGTGQPLREVLWPDLRDSVGTGRPDPRTWLRVKFRELESYIPGACSTNLRLDPRVDPQGWTPGPS